MSKEKSISNRKTALITGATSGIGRATAEVFAENGMRIILCGRRKERLEEIAEKLAHKVDVITLLFDVRDHEAVKTQFSTLPDHWKEIDILINSAGNAHGLAPIQDGEMSDWEAMIDINIKGLLYVTKTILPKMIERKKGHIVNIGSVAGKEVYPNGNVYCASKFAVDALNQAMRIDLLSHGIKVSGIHPGLVNTEFSSVRFKGDQNRAEKVYEGMTPLSGRDVAELIYFIVSRPHHVNIADTLIFPLDQGSSTQVIRHQ